MSFLKKNFLKKYEWNWTSNDFMDEDFDKFIEVSKKTKNDWWKSLDSFHLKTYAEHFKSVATHYFKTGELAEKHTTATAKTCPAITTGLLDKCILIKAPCDAYISINNNGVAYWNIKSPEDLNIESHATHQFWSKEKNPFENKINFKFSIPIIFDFKGDTTMFLQPQFHKQNYPFQVVNGSVNVRRKMQNVNVLIDIPKQQTEYYIKEGTVLAYLWLDNKNIFLEKNEKLRNLPNTRFFGNK